MTRLFCDGSPDSACIVIEEQAPIFIPYSERVTGNVGEYKAVILALKEAKRLQLEQVEVLTDSLLVVNQVSGAWACRHKHLLPFILGVRELAQALQAKIQWVPREENLAGKFLG